MSVPVGLLGFHDAPLGGLLVVWESGLGCRTKQISRGSRFLYTCFPLLLSNDHVFPLAFVMVWEAWKNSPPCLFEPNSSTQETVARVFALLRLRLNLTRLTRFFCHISATTLRATPALGESAHLELRPRRAEGSQAEALP